VGTYVRGLVGALLDARGGDDFVLFHREGALLPGEWRLPREGASPAALTRPRRGVTLWDQFAWPRTIARHDVAVFHSPFWTLPIAAASACALVQTLHDLTPVKLAHSVSLRNEMIFRANFACARFARRVIVPSRSTLADAVSLGGIRLERIRAIPEGIDLPPALLAAADQALPALRLRLKLGGRYLLHTGGQDPVKNLEAAQAAAAALVRRGLDLLLVVTGEVGRSGEEMRRRAAAMGIGDRLVMTGYLERLDLVALYRGASALLYPSINEGFGLPLLEAMACGTPVVAARAGALPEVGGGACLYAEPGDVEALASAAGSILADEELARRLSGEGRARAASFTWAEAARRTLEVYHEAAGSRP